MTISVVLEGEMKLEYTLHLVSKRHQRLHGDHNYDSHGLNAHIVQDRILFLHS